MGDIIGIDQSQSVIDIVMARLAQKGVLVVANIDGNAHIINAEGMANHRRASYTLQAQHDLSPEQVNDKAGEVVGFLEDAIRSGGDNAET